MGICERLPTVASCCCGCTLRTGTLILGWLYVIFSAIGLIGASSLLGNISKTDPDYDYNTVFASLVIGTVIYALQLLLGILLLWGTTQNKPNLILPYLWLQAILLVLNLINVIIAFFGLIWNGVTALVFWLLSVYFFMVVNSFYQQIRV